jgi:hypothetical protein
MIFPLEILPLGDPNGGVVYLGLFCLQRKHLAFVAVFGKGLSRKNNNMAVFPFAFHIAVQQTFRPLWS